MKQKLKNLNKYKFLLRELIKKTIKLKYRRSYLGILWTMIEPLLTMIVLTVVFGQLLGRDSTDPAFEGVPFPIYVLTGRLLYSFFSSSTNTAMKSIRNNSSMIKKVYVPRYIYPLSSVIANYLNGALHIGLVGNKRLTEGVTLTCSLQNLRLEEREGGVVPAGT